MTRARRDRRRVQLDTIDYLSEDRERQLVAERALTTSGDEYRSNPILHDRFSLPTDYINECNL